MTKKDRQFALARAKSMNKAKPDAFSLKGLLVALVSWKLWLFVGTYVFGVIGINSTSYFVLYLKSLRRYTIQQINLIPTAGNAIQFISMFIFASISDYTGNRVIPVAICAAIGFISCLLLSIWNIPFGLLIFAFLLGHGAVSQTILMGWFAEIFYDEPNLKALNIALGNTFVYSFNAFLPLAIYKTKDSPHFPVGYKISMMFYIIGFIFTWVFWYITNKYSKNREKNSQQLHMLESTES